MFINEIIEYDNENGIESEDNVNYLRIRDLIVSFIWLYYTYKYKYMFIYQAAETSQKCR